ncbi:MAG: ABC transporter transmembrane domain-containing protein, partial [Pseudomonadota bacterium]
MSVPAKIELAPDPPPDVSATEVGMPAALPGLPDATAFSACVRPFLDALGWMGEGRHFVEAHPHFDPIQDLDTLRAMLGRLGVQTHVHHVAISEIGADDLPCIALLRPDHPVVVLERIETDVFVVFDTEGNDLCEYVFDSQRLRCCFAYGACQSDVAAATSRFSWFSDALRSFRGPIVAIFGLTFVANVLALATPIYVMNVYNLVIGAHMIESLGYFFAALALALGFEFYLRRRRGKIMAYVGARFSASLLTTSFQRILGLPVTMIEAASVGSQVLRLKQFEGIHNLFTGALATALLDLPFVTLFFVAIAVISPVLVLVPVTLLIVYAALAWVLIPITRRNTRELNELQARNQTFLIDTITNLTTIQQLRGERWWHRRYAALSRELETKRFRVQFLDNVVTQGAQTLVMMSGIATLLIGAHLVMAGTLSIGGLIAVMMLIWRVLSPAQTLFVGLNKVSQFANSIRQVNALMAIPPERPDDQRRTVFRKFEGRITLDRVSFRYEAAQEPVLRAVSLDVRPGELVAIASPSAGGKST